MVSGNPARFVPEGTVDDPLAEEPATLQRLPMFWGLDVRVDRTWDKGWGNVTLFLDLQNVTNHRNVEFRESFVDETGVYRYEDVRGLPIIPYIGVEFAPR